MSVRYNPTVGVIMIVIGVVNLVLGFLLMQSGGSVGFSLLIGALLLVLGLMQLSSRAYFEFDQRSGTIVFKALIGPATRQFGGAKGGRLFVDGNRIYWVRADGRTKKVPVNRFFARKDQWQEVVSRIAQTPATGPAATA
jgi:hypothetical protein